MIGASGCGKSTLLNRLLGTEAQKTGAVREGDRRGRHTTVRRMLFRLPGSGCLIDTPGVREWGIWTSSGSEYRDEISHLASGCRFRNCTHTDEPGCAVTEAGPQQRAAHGGVPSLPQTAAGTGESGNPALRKSPPG